MRVVTAWSWPDAFGDITTSDLDRFQAALEGERSRIRHSNQSPEWAGHLLASLLDLDTAPETRGQNNLSADQKQARAKCKTILDRWQASGALAIENVEDVKKGRSYGVFVVGSRA